MGNGNIGEIIPLRSARKKNGVIKGVAVFLILAAVFVVLFMMNKRKNAEVYDKMSVIAYTEWDSSGTVDYISYKTGIVKISKDGAEAIGNDGRKVWNVAYNMKRPMGAACGSYCVIADRGQKQLCIIGPDGTSNQLTVTNPISDISVSAQGVAAVLVNAGNEDYIYLFSMNSKDGTSPLCEIKTVVENSGFPIEIKISEDGRKLVTAYMKVDNDDISNWITFYNFGDVGQNWIDHIVGSYNSGEAFVPEILMLKNNMVVVCKDNGFFSYKVDEVPETKAKREFTDKDIKSIVASENYICTVLMNTSGESRYTYIVCNTEGDVQKEFYAGKDFENILIHGEDIFVYGVSEYSIYSVSGNLKYTGTFDKKVNAVFSGGVLGEYIITGNGYIETVQFTGVE